MSNQILFANNAQTNVAGPIAAAGVTLNVTSGTGVLFPAPGANQFFIATFNDAATGLLREIVHVTAVVGDTLTIVRAQEGTVAQAWNAGDIFAALITAGGLQAMTQANSAWAYAADTGAANAYVLTLSPAPTAYIDGMKVRGKIGNTNSGASVLNVNGLGNIAVTKLGAVALIGGEMQLGQDVEWTYDSAGPRFQITSNLALMPESLAGAENLVITYTNTTAVVTANRAVLRNSTSGDTVPIGAVNVTINFAVNGANGLDTGAFAAGTGYFMFLIYNPGTNTIAGLGSLSATAPTLPAGYTSFVRVGANFSDGSTHFYNVVQHGKNVEFIASVRVLASGAAGVNTAISLVGIVPTTAGRVTVIYSNVGSASVRLYPENTFWSSTSPGFMSTDNSWSVGAQFQTPVTMKVPANFTIYWSAGATANSISLVGWDDSLIAG